MYMEEKLKKVFHSAYNHPKCRLSDDVWFLIKHRDDKRIKNRTILYSIFGILSLFAFAFFVVILVEQFKNSGFFEYLSLLLSDGALLLTYWKEFLFSLIESIPVMNLSLSFLMLFVFFFSIKKIANIWKIAPLSFNN